MKKITTAALVIMVAIIGFMIQANAQATTVTTNSIDSWDGVVYVPCAMGGDGEDVQLSGKLHMLYHTTLDDTGGFHMKLHFNPQGISGVGLTSGDKYQGTGVTQENFNGKVGEEYTYINNFRIIGQGPGNNLLVHENFHITVNADGTVTSYHDNIRTECK